MNVYLTEGGEPLRGDLVLSHVLRSALAPIPRTLELVLRDDKAISGKIVEGAKIWTGRELLKYHIVKVSRPKPSGMIQGDQQLAPIEVTALLDSCHRIAFRQPRAIIKEQARFTEVFRACGATAPVADDFTVARFSCFRGMVPSFHLAQALQEESGVMVLRDGKLSVIRIADLTKQTPVADIGQTNSADVIESQFLERHEIPSFYSLNDMGAFVMGDFSTERAVSYAARTDARLLNNMTRVMVERRVLNTTLATQINAGDAVKIQDKVLAVMTAVHVFEQDQENQGSTQTYSKFWLGEPSQ